MGSRPKTEGPQTIADVSAALASTQDVGEAMARAAKAIGGAEQASLVQIWSGSTADDLVCRGAWCTADDEAPRPDDPGERADLRAVLNGTDVVEWRAGLDPPEGAAALLEALSATRLVTLATRLDDRPAGALTLVQQGPAARLTPAERRRFATLAQLLAGPIHTVSAHEAGERATREIAALRAASRAVASLVESDQVVEAVKEQIAALIGGADCRVRVLLRSNSSSYTEFPPRAATDGRGGLECVSPTDLEERALADRRTAIATIPGMIGLATPLLLRGAPLGYLTVSSRREPALSDGEILAVESLAQQVCLALDMARLRRCVQRLTTMDTVTGLPNREFLFERLAAEIARARRYREPLSLIVIDFDDFARFNACHGNREGNRVLRSAANLVKTGLRADVDVACRLGGEEFAVLLPNTPAVAQGAGVVAERIRETIEATRFRDGHDKRLSHMTVTLGVAGFPMHAEDGEDLVGLACEALRAAKAAGKNRVGLYGLQG